MDIQTCSSTASVTTQQESELAKWQADRDGWANTLPMMHFLSQFLTLTPVVSPSFDGATVLIYSLGRRRRCLRGSLSFVRHGKLYVFIIIARVVSLCLKHAIRFFAT